MKNTLEEKNFQLKKESKECSQQIHSLKDTITETVKNNVNLQMQLKKEIKECSQLKDTIKMKPLKRT